MATPKVYFMEGDVIDKQFMMDELTTQEGSNIIPLESLIRNKSNETTLISIAWGSYEVILWEKKE